MSDIAVKCLPVSSPHSKPTWIAKRRLKIITTDHFPPMRRRLSDTGTGNDPQASPNATRDSDNREIQSPETVHPIPQAEGAQVPEPPVYKPPLVRCNCRWKKPGRKNNA